MEAAAAEAAGTTTGSGGGCGGSAGGSKVSKPRRARTAFTYEQVSEMQAHPSVVCSLGFVDIETKVVFQYEIRIVKQK